jgi:hypothetical protein
VNLQVLISFRRSSWDKALRTTRVPLSRYETFSESYLLFVSRANKIQAKDEQISDFIRKQYKSTTGSDIPIADKETKLG